MVIGPQLCHDRFGFAQLGKGETDRAGIELMLRDEVRFVGFHVGSKGNAGVAREARHALDVRQQHREVAYEGRRGNQPSGVHFAELVEGFGVGGNAPM